MDRGDLALGSHQGKDEDMSGNVATIVVRVMACAVIAIALLGCGFMAFAFWHGNAHGVPGWKLSRLETGVTAAKARRFLGSPSDVSPTRRLPDLEERPVRAPGLQKT
jgi:hypothetical protein